MNKRLDAIIVRRSSDAVAGSEPAGWAASRLAAVCAERGIAVRESESPDGSEAERLTLVIAGPESAHIAGGMTEERIPREAESFCLHRYAAGERQIVQAAARDARGLVYAVLELADRIRLADDPLEELSRIGWLEEKPSSPVRSINRLFVSDVEDKPWFYDEQFWDDYLTELAAHRFNRLHLALGMGYDYGHDPGVQDNYFCFAYPFLLTLPDYEVRAKGLEPGETERNLAMLRHIAREAKRRGIHFQLGLWNHGYDPSESPHVRYPIEGIKEETHARYCRDAVRTLLQACPDIDGVTIRTHYEGGIPEPAEPFWQEVFAGIAECGRRVEVDLHAKGVDWDRLNMAIEAGLPVIVSPKFWAEHMGPPYHQAAIRPLELPTERTDRPDMMSITATYRRFTRYGYADFLREDRKYGVLYRIWPGTQRVLLWGDPAMAAGYGRAGTFGGALGVELCEPLTFKGRKGSGTEGGRDPYKDPALRLGGQEWRKYGYSYRLWGRLLYNPDADPESWRRYLRAEFGGGAEACERALAHASRILPLLTAAHLPSAANNAFWPEMYANMPIVKTGKKTGYDFDTLEPKTFGAVSPLDPALFYRIDDFADDLLKGDLSGKYSPAWVADRLDELAAEAERGLADAEALVRDRESAVYRRWSVDAAVQSGLGRFFAHKLRAGILYALFERTGGRELLEEARSEYRSALGHWKRIVAMTVDVYRENITFGYVPYMRGHWSDRTAAIEEDIAAMERVLEAADRVLTPQVQEAASVQAGTGSTAAGVPVTAAAVMKAGSPDAARPEIVHTPPVSFRRGEPVRLSAAPDGDAGGLRVLLHYRHAEQSEAWRQAEMERQGAAFAAEIPAEYTGAPYPLVYFFELKDASGRAWLAPGFDDTLSGQPYYVLRQV
ncbi:hypothetical protein [Paenibacillus humicola]|uniref:hypothetical protein n=1 Tax=Paenibacillus humicola TaxID=3110540 RepID=UPI00237BC220|nr:hypothetical protein [Paenibacillus humicola]